MSIPTAPDRETVLANCRPRYGNTNPERTENPYWEWAIRAEMDPYTARNSFKIPVCREHRCLAPDSRYREHEEGPVWTFCRFGMSKTDLKDGRTLFIAGEHEDWYDPDFCIYNDVIIQGPGEKIEVFVYPPDVFPPTDFHTATRVGDKIYIIGNVGYMNERQPGITPVYTLDLTTMAIGPVDTTGANPGWIGNHEAVYIASDNEIMISGGSECVDGEKGHEFVPAPYDYALRLDDMTWTCAG